ncbi:hypothetical protein FLJU110815_04590 [Flavobacterium jumunjinense]
MSTNNPCPTLKGCINVLKKLSIGENIELKKLKILLYRISNLSLYGNSLEYKNNPTISRYKNIFNR